MFRRLILPAVLSLVVCVSSASAGHYYYYAPQSYYVVPPAVTYYPPVFPAPVAQTPVFVAPTTVVVQRPVYVAQPVVVPEPVFVEVPAATVTYPAPAPIMPAGYTTVRYRGPLWPLGHRDKLEYQVHTPYGTHKYKYRTSWWDGTTRFDYDFDD